MHIRSGCRTKTVVWAAISALAFASGVGGQAPSVAEPEDFGLGTSRRNGELARGERPLLTILMEFEDASFRFDHTPPFYRDLLFGPLGAGSFGTDPGNVAGRRGFFEENSYGDFRFRNAGVLGPFSNPDDPDTPGDESFFPCAKGQIGQPDDTSDPDSTWECGEWRWSDRRDRLVNRSAWKVFGNAIREAGDDGFDYGRYDVDGNGRVSPDELAILIIDANPSGFGGCGINRSTIPNCVAVSGDVDVCGRVAAVGEAVGAGTLAHELAHHIGIGYEAYGAWGLISTRGCLNQFFTTMACTCGMADGRNIVHLDPFSKMKLGWLAPKVIPITDDRCVDLAPVEFDRSAYILYDPERGTDEFFMLEYRNPNLHPLEDGIGPESAINYDADPWDTGALGLSDQGLGLWYVQIDSSSSGKAPVRVGPLRSSRKAKDRALFLIPPQGSSPDVDSEWGDSVGGDGFWDSGDPEARPTWFDGTPSGLSVKVIGPGVSPRTGDPVLRVRIGDAECPPLEEEDDEGELPVEHPCLTDVGLREVRCGWVSPWFDVSRRLAPWPISPGAELEVSWSVTPRQPLAGSRIRIEDAVPQGWVPVQQTSTLVFDQFPAPGQSITRSYPLKASDDPGGYLFSTKLEFEPSPNLPGLEAETFRLESLHAVWEPDAVGGASPPDLPEQDLSDLPDLAVSVNGPTSFAPGDEVETKLDIAVSNTGGEPAPGNSPESPGYVVDLVLSTDDELPEGFAVFQPTFEEDVLLRGGRASSPPMLGAGEMQRILEGEAFLPEDVPPGTYCLGVIVDPGDAVVEVDDGHKSNAYCHEIRIGQVSPTFRRGDCNDDGNFDISDAIFVLGNLFLGDADRSCDDACDANDDGAVDISDAIGTLGVLFLGQGQIPFPGVGDCGIDPTDDELGCETPQPDCP